MVRRAGQRRELKDSRVGLRWTYLPTSMAGWVCRSTTGDGKWLRQRYFLSNSSTSDEAEDYRIIV